jgi:zinc protease
MKKSLRIHRNCAALAAVLLVLFSFSCASTGAPKSSASKFPLAALGDSFGSEGMSSFAKDSLSTFSTFVLSNNIPVIVKKSPASKVLCLSLVIRGGSQAATTETAGHELLALKTMARGSASYTYEAIQNLLDETSSSMAGSSDFDASYYTLTTLDKYFDRLFPVWIDTIVRPSFAQSDFDQELANAKLALQSKEQDPWSKTGLSVNELFFSGHSYASSPEGTASSLASANLDSVKSWYARRMRAGSLFIVAVGNFDTEKLRRSLESGLGALPASDTPTPARAVAIAHPGPGKLSKVEYPQSKGVAYVRGDFPAPNIADPDYVPLSIGMSIFSDLLFHIVRDEHGAVYSPMTTIRSFDANYGTVALYKTSVPGDAKAYIDEAAAILASGRGMALDPESSPDGYAPIPEILDAIKARFTNSVYESQATNAAIASQIARSVLSTGDYRYYLLNVDRIAAVTPDKIHDALKKYLFGGSLTWVVLGDASTIANAKSESFISFNVGDI